MSAPRGQGAPRQNPQIMRDLEDAFDDERHIKLVYFARHAGRAQRGEEVTGMDTIAP